MLGWSCSFIYSVHVHPTLCERHFLKHAIYSNLLHISLLPCMLYQTVHACTKLWWWFHADGQLSSTTPLSHSLSSTEQGGKNDEKKVCGLV